MIGFHSDMIWIPEHKVGAVILTNGDPGGIIRGAFRRKLLEVLFDGKPEADENVVSAATTIKSDIAAERKLLAIPADGDAASKLAKRYTSPALGDIAVTSSGGATTFDFGEWKSDVASRMNPDGTTSFITVRPGMVGKEFVVGAAGAKRTLTIRDGQPDYVLTEKN
jgi:hypothetical protein